ncbi:hypothetical protein S96127_1540 [Yersinia pestis]|nr:hypothetical protein S96127_1540 [Yersinia pestis]
MPRQLDVDGGYILVAGGLVMTAHGEPYP